MAAFTPEVLRDGPGGPGGPGGRERAPRPIATPSGARPDGCLDTRGQGGASGARPDGCLDTGGQGGGRGYRGPLPPHPWLVRMAVWIQPFFLLILGEAYGGPKGPPEGQALEGAGPWRGQGL